MSAGSDHDDRGSMRDFLETGGSDAVRDRQIVASARKDLPKRFFEEAQSVENEGRYELRLDGRPARTPGRAVLHAVNERVGQALADEWNALGERIDPLALPLTRILNSAIDAVASQRDAVRDDIAAYAGSDLLCYRASEPAALVERQEAKWDGPLAAAEEALGSPFLRADGIVHVEQPAQTLRQFRAGLEAVEDFGALAALHVTTSITGSAVLALGILRGWLPAEEAWAAAHVDEDWNRELWGADEEADRVRAQRRRDFDAAALILATASDDAARTI